MTEVVIVSTSGYSLVLLIEIEFDPSTAMPKRTSSDYSWKATPLVKTEMDKIRQMFVWMAKSAATNVVNTPTQAAVTTIAPDSVAVGKQHRESVKNVQRTSIKKQVTFQGDARAAAVAKARATDLTSRRASVGVDVQIDAPVEKPDVAVVSDIISDDESEAQPDEVADTQVEMKFEEPINMEVDIFAFEDISRPLTPLSREWDMPELQTPDSGSSSCATTPMSSTNERFTVNMNLQPRRIDLDFCDFYNKNNDECSSPISKGSIRSAVNPDGVLTLSSLGTPQFSPAKPLENMITSHTSELREAFRSSF